MVTLENAAEIGRRLKEARLRAGASQADAGEATGVNRATVSNWEAGRNLPSLLQFRVLLTLYLAPSHEILFGHAYFTLTRKDSAELSRAMDGFSDSLRGRMELLLSIAGEHKPTP
jgi:transcriptional regulator with XRE-family HTH domain